MAPTLDDIPDELFEWIVKQLEPCDIFHLRLSSRTLASKATQTRFKSFFHTRHVDLDERSLTQFVLATKNGGFGCLVKHLVLVGLVHDPVFLEYKIHNASVPDNTRLGSIDARKKTLDILNEQCKALRIFHDLRKSVRLLSQALRNLNEGTAFSSLPSLSLQIGFCFHNGRRHELPVLPITGAPRKIRGDIPEFEILCEAASQTFCLTMESLALSRLTVQSLDVFNGATVQRRSLVSTRLNDIETEYPGLRACFAPMKTLSLSLCEPKRPETERPRMVLLELSADGKTPRSISNKEDEAVEPDDSRPIGLSQLLQMVPALEDLDLHYFTRPGPEEEEDNPHSGQLLKHTLLSTSLPTLKSCRIRGLHSAPDDLTSFLQRTKPSRISLQNIYTLEETWRPVLDHLTSPETGIEHIHLEDLFEWDGYLLFDRSGKPNCYPDAPIWSPLVRDNDAVRLRIDYRATEDRVRSSESHYKWTRWREKEYGWEC